MKLFLIAGEPSGDRLGAALMAGLKSLLPGLEFAGVGGPLMQAMGMTSLFPMDELSVMGIAEVLPKYVHLKRRIAEAAAAALTYGPAALITIDSPDFCLRVAAIVKEAQPNLRTIHYVAPSVWAWRPGRAGKMARVIDHVLALLPFEPPYMTAAGMTCDFVGHPVVSEIPTKASKPDFGDSPLILVLPGSRRAEVTRLAPVFGQTMAAVLARYPKARIVLPTLAAIAPLVTQLTKSWRAPPQIITDAAQKRTAFTMANAALAASGTVSLELAAHGCPMVIAYDMHPVSLWLMQRMARIDTVTLVNLVSETRAIPEFIGRNCHADLIAPALLDVLEDPSRQMQAMQRTMDLLGRGGEPPGLRAARSVLSRL